jgi:hypothetical protein
MPSDLSDPQLMLANMRSLLVNADLMAAQRRHYEEEEKRLKERMEHLASEKNAAAERLRLNHAAFVGWLVGMVGMGWMTWLVRWMRVIEGRSARCLCGF